MNSAAPLLSAEHVSKRFPGVQALRNVDFTLDRVFKLGERQDLRFRADFFNLFNHPSFANPAATSDSAAGGGSAPITSTVGTPRLIQFSLKYSF